MWQQAKRNVDLWAEQQEVANMLYSTSHFHKFGNKVGKLLAKLCSGPKWPTHISAMKYVAGSLVTSPAAISKLLADYFTNLYSADLTD